MSCIRVNVEPHATYRSLVVHRRTSAGPKCKAKRQPLVLGACSSTQSRTRASRRMHDAMNFLRLATCCCFGREITSEVCWSLRASSGPYQSRTLRARDRDSSTGTETPAPWCHIAGLPTAHDMREYQVKKRLCRQNCQTQQERRSRVAE